MKVCVIGAGIVGCATAYRLARDGHAVVLLDAAAGPALGASFANGAQLSYSYVEPLASPATLRCMPGMLLDPASPLAFRPRLDWRQWRWGLRFLAACTRTQARRGTVALWALAQASRAALDEWRAEEGWSFDFAENGKLVLCPDAASLARQREQVAFQAALGCRQEVLDARACLEREPALAGYAGRFAGGVWTAGECVGDPHRLAELMADGARRLGGRLRFSTRVTGWRAQAGRIAAVRTRSAAGDGEEEIEADAFVLAAGPAAAALAAPLGVDLPVYTIKGYSLTLSVRPQRSLPAVSVTDLSRKTVFAPLAGRLRVAAMADIVGHDLSLPPERLRRMRDAVEAVYPGLADWSCATSPWAGLRPATPTSVPIIGRAPRWANLWLNAGHGALGLTLAAGSAVALARQLNGDSCGGNAPKRA
jgi:D-amino-acid dehydrogenase